jgi:hypothetical protein
VTRLYLRSMAGLLLLGGLLIAVIAGSWAVFDEPFFKAAEALERHPDHVLFQGEYYAALVRHIAYIVIAIVGFLLGTVASAMLFGMHAVMVRLERLEATVAGRPR